MARGARFVDLAVSKVSDLPRSRAAVGIAAIAFNVAVSDAVLASSELVTNALQHAKGSCRLVVAERADGATLRIEVSDTSKAMPEFAHGHGLSVVDQITTRWGVMPRRAGKTVWFELDARSPAG